MSKHAKIMAHLPGLWYVAPAGLAQLRTGLTRALAGAQRWDEDDEHEHGTIAYAVDGTTAVIYIRGIILPDSADEWTRAWTGWVTYGDIVRAVVAAARDGRVREIRLDFDCLGGAATGCYEAGMALLEAATQKPLVAYARGYCTSAAYWLACSCERIVASPDGTLGSIGTVGELYDDTKMLADWGVRRIVLTGTQSPRKRPDLSSPDGLVDIQQEIDDLTENFVRWVAGRRGRTRDQVIAEMGGGGSLVGARAMAAGLCDEVLDLLPGQPAVAAPDVAVPSQSGAPTAPPPPPQQSRAGKPGRLAAPPMRAAAPGDTMDSFEPQCLAAVAAAHAALAVLDAENTDHDACRTACDGVITAGAAASDAGEEGFKPGSPEGLALADACDACAAECNGLAETPECKACAASCEACSIAARGTTAETTNTGGDPAKETQMSAQEKALRAQLARTQTELRTERTIAEAAQRTATEANDRAKKLEGRNFEQDMKAIIDRHDARGAVGVNDREAWEKDGREHGLEFLDACLSRIPDGSVRPVQLRGSDLIPASISEMERKRTEVASIQQDKKCSRAEAMRLWAQQEQQKRKERAAV